MSTVINLNERSKNDFLIYANSVIKSRAIPFVEDNLKPIHRKILWTLFEDKVTPDKKTKKCATEAGRVLAYSPHGDASVYNAMVRMGQWWKLRYPLVYIQGNCGNILGDGPASSRYTECKLTDVGMLMLEGVNSNAVDFKPNYDGTCEEPVTLPSKFPYLLCGNNSGIAVGLSSDLVSHNYTEVAAAIKYYLEHKDCSIADLMKFIQGPDFPTGGQILNGDELPDIYSCGRGSVKVAAHYDVVAASGGKTLLVFHDLPYGVEIDSGVKAPLKKLVLDEGYEAFEDIDVKKVGPHNFDITITLGKGADIQKCLDILFAKTRLADTIKINQTVIINGEPRLLNLKQLIQYYVDTRSSIIKRMAANDYGKTNHKLTVTLGLQKCMSDIDKLVALIRNSASRTDAKSKIMIEFSLNDEQADAVLDMKLSRLSKLDLSELNDTQKDLEETLAKLRDLIDNETTRFKRIAADLDDMKRIIGKDDRITEICYRKPIESIDAPVVKKEWLIYPNGLGTNRIGMDGVSVESSLIDVVMAYNVDDIFVCNSEGEIAPITMPCANIIRATVAGKEKIVSVTTNGNIKVSLVSEYKLKRAEKVMKLKDGDSLVYAGFASDDDYLMLFNADENKVLKLAVKDLPVASKSTVGVKSGFENITSADVVGGGDKILSVTAEGKGKFTPVADYSVDSRGNKGQTITENTMIFKCFAQGRGSFYVIPKTGKPITMASDKISLKSKTAVGAAISTRALNKII